MVRTRRIRLAFTSRFAVILGVGILGCSSSLDFLDGPDESGDPSKTAGSDNRGDASRGTIVRTSYPAAYAAEADRGAADAGGCPESMPLPHELAKATLPSYVIEPPDVLFIDVIRLVPKPPYRIEPLDVLLIQVAETLPSQPIGAAPYPVSPEGTVNLGYSYGVVQVAGLTLEQAAQNIQQHLRRTLKNPQVAVALAQFRGVQQTRGEHLVQMDGSISLGRYGCVPVTGLTLSQAKRVIENYLSQWLLNPQISLNVSAFNSKVYYIILDGGGQGQRVFRFPVTGNETVLDAISQINGLPPISSRHKIWVARPTPAKKGCYEILPVNWQGITQAGDTETNYQLFPGDRIYVKAHCLLHFNNRLPQFLHPVSNRFGATVLGAGTVGIGNSGG